MPVTAKRLVERWISRTPRRSSRSPTRRLRRERGIPSLRAAAAKPFCTTTSAKKRRSLRSCMAWIVLFPGHCSPILPSTAGYVPFASLRHAKRRNTMRKVLGIYGAPRPHWVGDGFPVRSLFSHASHGEHVSPFLLLDYAGPAEFTPADRPRGVGTHPHRGFE